MCLEERRMGECTFIHCGDIHLDARFTASGLTGDKAKARRQELRDTFAGIIDEVIGQKAQLLLISGDLFEHDYVRKDTAEFVINQFKRIPEVKIFISPGNHDPYVSNSYYAMLDWPPNVHIFTGAPECVPLPDCHAVICGAGFTGPHQYESMLQHGPIPGDEYSSFSKILVVHGTVDSIGDECPYHPINSKALSGYGFDYVALGHFHKTARYMDGSIVYCGSPEPLGFDEPGEHGVIVGKASGNRIETRFIKMHKREYVTKEMDISGLTGMEEVEQTIRGQLEGQAENIVRIVLAGRKKRDMEIDVDLIVSRQQTHCYCLKIIDRTSPDYHFDALSKQHNLKGVFVRKMLEEVNGTRDEEKRKNLYKALYMGLDALEFYNGR